MIEILRHIHTRQLCGELNKIEAAHGEGSVISVVNDDMRGGEFTFSVVYRVKNPEKTVNQSNLANEFK